MNNKVPGFTDQEWELMKDYIDNSSKQPRQNLIELISHVDPSVAQLGMNSGPYFMLDRLLTDEQIDFAEPSYIWDGKVAYAKKGQFNEIIDLAGKKDAMPNTLSGGQKQRVAIARALAGSPAIILADEPTGNLDSGTELEVMGLLKNCVKEYHQTLVMITHDETIAQMADRIVVIEDGKVVRNS